MSRHSLMNFKVHCQLYVSDGKLFSYLLRLESLFLQIQGMQVKDLPSSCSNWSDSGRWIQKFAWTPHQLARHFSIYDLDFLLHKKWLDKLLKRWRREEWKVLLATANKLHKKMSVGKLHPCLYKSSHTFVRSRNYK